MQNTHDILSHVTTSGECNRTTKSIKVGLQLNKNDTVVSNQFVLLAFNVLSQLARHDARPFPFRLLDQLTFNVHFFYRASSNRAVYAVVLCPSVCLSQAGIV